MLSVPRSPPTLAWPSKLWSALRSCLRDTSQAVALPVASLKVTRTSSLLPGDRLSPSLSTGSGVGARGLGPRALSESPRCAAAAAAAWRVHRPDRSRESRVRRKTAGRRRSSARTTARRSSACRWHPAERGVPATGLLVGPSSSRCPRGPRGWRARGSGFGSGCGATRKIYADLAQWGGL